MQLVVSDAHTGLKQAIAAVLAGAAWQRCRVHFLRNALARVPKASAEMVAVTIRTIFAQLTPAEVADQVDKVAATLPSPVRGGRNCIACTEVAAAAFPFAIASMPECG